MNGDDTCERRPIVVSRKLHFRGIFFGLAPEMKKCSSHSFFLQCASPIHLRAEGGGEWTTTMHSRRTFGTQAEEESPEKSHTWLDGVERTGKWPASQPRGKEDDGSGKQRCGQSTNVSGGVIPLARSLPHPLLGARRPAKSVWHL